MAVVTQSVNSAMVKLETVVRTAFLFLCVLSGLFASGQDATITDAQCVHGFVNVTNPNITSSQYISEGFYLFPKAMFTCNGRIVGFQGRAYFEGGTQYYYNGRLVLSLQFWKEEQGHYAAPVRNHTLSLAIAGIDNDNVVSSGTYPGKYFFRNRLIFPFSNSLEEAIEVEAGDVLAVYLPPRTKNEAPNAINSIPLVIADSPGIRVQSPTPCWSPQGQIVCHPVLPFTGIPLLSFEFERSPVVTVPRVTPTESKPPPQDRVEDTEQEDTEQADTERADTENAQCVHGFVNVTYPNITSSQYISEGFYLFPTAMFKCNGRILGFQARAYFEGGTGHYYNRSLVLSLQFWKEEQGHYAAPVRNHTLSLATGGIDNDNVVSSASYPGNYVFRKSQFFQFSNSLEEAIEVEAGDVLAVYLPPKTKNEAPNAINSIPLVIADSPGIRVQSPTPCWSPQGQIVCHPVLPFTGIPLLSFEFERSPVVTVPRVTPTGSKPPPQDRGEDTEQEDTEQEDTEQADTERTAAPTTTPSSTPVMHQPSAIPSTSQTGLSSSYTAVGFACLFAFLFVLAAITVLVLVCVVVAPSRRKRKSTALHAREQDCKEQGTGEALPPGASSPPGYEKLSVEAQYTNPGQSCGGPLPSEGAGGKGPN